MRQNYLSFVGFVYTCICFFKIAFIQAHIQKKKSEDETGAYSSKGLLTTDSFFQVKTKNTH